MFLFFFVGRGGGGGDFFFFFNRSFKIKGLKAQTLFGFSCLCVFVCLSEG